MYIISLRYFIPWVLLPVPYTSTSIWLQQRKTTSSKPPQKWELFRMLSVPPLSIILVEIQSITHHRSPNTLIFCFLVFFYINNDAIYLKR